MRNQFQDDITYVIADTKQHELSKLALSVAHANFPLNNRLVFSDRSHGWDATKFVQINTMQSIEDYSQVIVQEAWKHINTKFALIIQWDGFVLNASQFKKEFLDYDYIGAPWPHFEDRRVGNGGFSLRSRRLMKASAHLAQSINDWTKFPEDVLICRTLSKELEEQQMRFAPESVAAEFAMEGIIPTKQPFGFHGAHFIPVAFKGAFDHFLSLLIPPSKTQLNSMKIGVNAMDDRSKIAFNSYLTRHGINLD